MFSKKKKIFKKMFQAFSSKKGLLKFFFRRFTKFQQFKKKCCPRVEDRPIFEDLRSRGQGLVLRGQGQGLQNVSSRTSSRPRTSSRTPPQAIMCILWPKILQIFHTSSKNLKQVDISLEYGVILYNRLEIVIQIQCH